MNAPGGAMPNAPVATEAANAPAGPPPSVDGYNMEFSTNASRVVAAPAATMENAVGITMKSYDNQSITADEMRKSLLALVSEHCCYGKGAVNDMEVKDIVSLNSFHCMWETFSEKRTTSWCSCSYSGGMIDSANNGIAPGPWEMTVQGPDYFVQTDMDVKVPHTDYVQQCDDCLGRGRNQCNHCYGRGRVNCNWCNGSGYRIENGERRYCSSCNGEGRVRCYSCGGDGMVRCSRCDGSGRLLYYINMKVEFINHVEHEIIDVSGINGECIKDATGDIICQQQGYRLLPPQEISDPSLRTACSTLFNKAEAFINSNAERLLQQRVTVRCVPVSKASGVFKDSYFDFWVYGKDQSCYCPDYPQQKCWGCEAY